MKNESFIYSLVKENFKDPLDFCRELLTGLSYTDLKKVESKVETPGSSVYSAKLGTCEIFFYFTKHATGRGEMTYDIFGEEPENLGVRINSGVLGLTMKAILEDRREELEKLKLEVHISSDMFGLILKHKTKE